MKAEKEKQKKEEKDNKKLAKENGTKEDDHETGRMKGKGKSKGRGKGRGKQKKPVDEEVRKEDDQHDESTGEEEEKPEKPRRRLRKAAVDDLELELPDADENPPKKKRTKAEAKTKAEPKVKQAPKRKAKAKAAAKRDLSEDDAENMVTPKKALFQSDDDCDEEESVHYRVDKKSGKTLPLKSILEKEQPENHRRAKQSKPSKDEEQEPSAASQPARKKPKINKVNLSPFTKKEKSRRQKHVKGVMEKEATEDRQIQAICLQHMKNVDGFESNDQVKDYLQVKLKNDKYQEFKLDEYWSRPAVGVKVPKLADGSLKNAPLVAYFGKYGTCPDGWKFNITAAYVSASLMVSSLCQHFGKG